MFADFPYLPCSTNQRLLTLETWCGYGNKQRCTWFVHLVFQGQRGAHPAPQTTKHFTYAIPYLQAICFQGATQLARKGNSSGSTNLHGQSYSCYHHIFTHWLGIVDTIPCRCKLQCRHSKTSLISEDWLTHVQVMFTWNHSPHQFSKLPFE